MSARRQAGGKYHCETCDMGYASKTSRDAHIIKAHGATPLSCPHCGKTFNDRTNLNRHIRGHGKADVAWWCYACGRKVGQRADNARRHEQANKNGCQGQVHQRRLEAEAAEAPAAAPAQDPPLDPVLAATPVLAPAAPFPAAPLPAALLPAAPLPAALLPAAPLPAVMQEHEHGGMVAAITNPPPEFWDLWEPEQPLDPNFAMGAWPDTFGGVNTFEVPDPHLPGGPGFHHTSYGSFVEHEDYFAGF